MAVMPGAMHQADLGVFKHILDCIHEELTPAKRKLMDNRLEVVRNSARINYFHIPHGQYFYSGSMYSAAHHRAVM